jgi:hypothetical protein
MLHVSKQTSSALTIYGRYTINMGLVVPFCSMKRQLVTRIRQRNIFDIGYPAITSFPPVWAAGYLNSEKIQEDLGVPLNFTGESLAVSDSKIGKPSSIRNLLTLPAFTATGDFIRGGNLQSIGNLLNRGVKVALMYGDRDYQCNCE